MSQEPLLDTNDKTKEKSPLENANFLSRLFFFWTYPILKVTISSLEN